ncbi:MAG TPA: hypothetical protein VMU89_09820 [Thermomicrobiaceae bacterium]|nr:hypothetical protein [Thermomicrobiaceae bacterium]
MAGERTRIDAGVVVAFQDGEHRILHDGVVVVEGNEILHVGRGFDGTVDRTLDARRMLVTPGLINTHTHLSKCAAPRQKLPNPSPHHLDARRCVRPDLR